MGAFSRLGMNFNPAIFGNAVNFQPGQNLVYSGATSLQQWQINDLVNSTANGYFYNPMANNLSAMYIVANNIVAITSNTVFLNGDGGLPAVANNFLAEVANFSDHTNRISNVTQSQDKLNLPDYTSAIAIGSQTLSVVNQTDGLQNNVPVLGNFTSLTVANTIAYDTIIITADYATLNSSISTANIANVIVNVSNLNSNAVNTIVSDIQSTYNLMNTYRTNDVNFYKNSISLVQDYQTVSQFNNMSVTSENIIRSYIGTPKLISNLNNK